MKRVFSLLMVTLLLISMFAAAFSIRAAETGLSQLTVPDESATMQETMSVASQEPPQTEWNKTYGGTGLDDAYALVQTVDGGYALAGYTTSFGAGGYNFWLVKTDATGSALWNKTYGGTGSDWAWALVQTVDGGYALAGSTASNFWLVKIAPSNVDPPDDCGWPVLVAPVQISSNAGYGVGDTLTARFTIQNQGTAAIHLDKLLLGGRFNGGTLPGGGFPDFSYSSVTLQINQTYHYEGTLYLAEGGYYQFFVAYYIANPTEAEKQLLDSNNWNTCIDLAQGLTDNDRTWSVQVDAVGNLRAVSIEPVQVVWGVDLVQDKATDFRIGYESTFDVIVETDVRLEIPGFDPNSYQFKYKFAPGSHEFIISSEIASSPFFLACTKPEAMFKFTIDPGNLILEVDETDNTFPRTDFERRAVTDTKPLNILVVAVRFDGEDGHPGYFNGFSRESYEEHAAESARYIRAAYPLAESEVSYRTTCFNAPVNAGPRPATEADADARFTALLQSLSLRAGSYYDRVIGVVRGNWFAGIPGWDGTIGFAGQGWGKGAVVTVGYWKTSPHEIGHTYSLDHSNDNGIGYYVIGRRSVNAQTLMSTGAIPNPPTQDPYRTSVPSFWIRTVEYQTLLTVLTKQADPEILLVTGTFWQNGTVELTDWCRFPSGVPDFEVGNTGNYYVAQRDGVGNLLSVVGFNVTFEGAIYGHSFEKLPLAFTIPYASGAKVAQILNQTGHTVAIKTTSDNAPTVSVVSPNGGEILTSDYAQVSWEASDLDGDPLVYNLLISGDGGLTWNPIETGLKQTTYNLPLTGFSGGSQYVAKIIASDGINTGEDVSDGFFTIASFTIKVVTTAQIVPLGGKTNYTLNITSYGGFSNPIKLNASSSTTDKLVFRWLNGTTIALVPDGSTTTTVEVEVPDVAEGGNQTLILSGTYGNNTEVSIAYLFASSHDLTISGITSSKTVVGQGFSMTVNVTVENHGNFGETFPVSLYGNQTLILKGSIYLSPQSSTTVALVWNTSGFAKGNYTISAYAGPVPNETYTTDNTYIGEIVTVAMPGDVNADGTLDIFDIATVALAFSSTPTDPNWNPVADINNDGLVDIFDIVIVALHFGETV